MTPRASTTVRRPTVDPRHLKDVRMKASADNAHGDDQETIPSSDRSRRMRDAVEAALSDIILLGTVEQVRLASQAANDMVAGRPIKTAELVISLRDFIRVALDLGPIPNDITIAFQGPTRVQSGGRGRSDGEKGGGKGSGGGGEGALLAEVEAREGWALGLASGPPTMMMVVFEMNPLRNAMSSEEIHPHPRSTPPP